jgi:adenosylcobinamide-GDP ribazoletransferase
MKLKSDTFTLPPGLVTAVRTLTILPIPGEDTTEPNRALPWFPLVGAVLGILIWAPLATLQHLGFWPAGVGIVGVGLSVFLTRGLHLDGLADWADGFWGGWTRERILAIMKDSSLGTFGTVALILIMLAKWSSIVALVESDNMHWIALAMIISRAVQVDIAVTHPYARPEGGTGSAFISKATRKEWIPALCTACGLVFLFGAFTWRPLAALAAAGLLGRCFGGWSHKKIGGVTGDILGATSEFTETLVLMLGAAIL